MSARRRRKLSRRKVATGAVTLGIAALGVPAADAATFTVSNLNDTGAGSLRQAVASANGAAGADTINFQAGLTGTITLTSGEIKVTDSVDIQGPGPATLSVSGNNASRVFYLYSPSANIDVKISGLTVTGGAGAYGGAITDLGEILTLDNMVITQNNATNIGGAVAATGPQMSLTIRNSTVSNNTSVNEGGGIFIGDGGPVLIESSVISGNDSTTDSGGGIYLYDTSASVTIRDTTISGNTAFQLGGGIYLYDTDGGTFRIERSTISNNTAADGGGMFLYGPDFPVIIENTTISGNNATSGVGGGAYIYYAADVTFNFATIASNTSAGTAGGIAVANGVPQMTNSIVADNTALTDPDLATTPSSSFTVGYSLVETPGGATINDAGGNITGVDPLLGPLANNGGPTQTHLPGLTSPVINNGDPAYAGTPATDQRGFPRKIGAAVDMGSVELNGGTIQFSSATYNVNENGASITITVTRTGGTDPATVDYGTADGSAQFGSDYTTTSNTINFGAGQTSATFNVPILDDNAVEGNETFNLILSNPTGGAVLGANANAVVTIVDVEPGVLQLSSATYNVNENGGALNVVVNRTNGSTEAVSVNYATSNGSANAGADYTTTNGILNFAVGQTSANFNVPILDDNLVEGNETFNITLSNPTNGAVLGAPSSAVATIVDVEPGTFALATSSQSVNENAGSVTIVVTRSAGSTNAASVTLTTSNGSATAGSDYTATTTIVPFSAGQTSANVNVPILDDNAVEGAETFNVALSSPTNGAILGAPSTEVVTINDIEGGTVQFTVSATSVNEAGGPLVLTVTRTGGSNGPVSVTYSTANGSATAGSDYTATSGILTFADGDTTPQQISIPINNDGIPEGNETFTITLSGAQTGTPSSVTATIIDATPPMPIPLLDSFGKLLLALFTAITGLFVMNRNRITGFFLAALLIGALSVPAHAKTNPWKHGANKPGKVTGTIASVVTSGDKVTVNLTGGQSVSVPVASVRVVDLRGPRRTRATTQTLAAGMTVKIVTTAKQTRVKIVSSLAP